MKRSGFKSQGKPMKRTRFKRDGKPLNRGKSQLKRYTTLKSNPDLHDWVAMAEEIFVRSGGRCERCKRRILRNDITKANIHHIFPRSAGGQDTPMNLAFLCGPLAFMGREDRSCHTHVHQHPKESRIAGWLK